MDSAALDRQLQGDLTGAIWLGPSILAPAIVLSGLYRGLRWDHCIVTALVLAVPWLGSTGRRFSRSMTPFVGVAVLFENFALLARLRGSVHVGDLYRTELALFGIGGQTLPEYFAVHNHPVVDVLAGIGYAGYLPVVILAAVVLFFIDARQVQRLAWAFFGAYAIGFLVWIAYPAAPPWYVMDHGLGPAKLDVAASAAGALRVDRLLGVDLFANIYARNTNVFGAMPSLHVATPAVAALVTWRRGGAWRLLVPFTTLVAFAAVYLSHHYLLDVIAGFVVAMVAVRLAWFARRPPNDHVIRTRESVSEGSAISPHNAAFETVRARDSYRDHDTL